MTENGSTLPQDPANAGSEAQDFKGKGKATAGEQPMDTAMDEDDDDDDEDEDEDEEVAEAAEEEDEDGLDAIDTNNIISGGRRTRGRVIDFAKAAAENPAPADEDEDDDEDFEAPDEDVKMQD
ncbi:uncharacterized protein DNG_06073 [Cephalotrichum gorgonifer]|uniref:Histone chaperone domain-containing protein n=1 Tax=Cephalotrichum gorgonifer TaxID=2041049 RepID=A0AAE8SW44_9PEZI|nr:uncharacterized protein DNG_06073 [Cephalotrichum gorgonifer]